MPYAEEAGTAYSELIDDQLTEERARKISLEQRGITVITTSGTLVTLLLGIGAIVTALKSFVPSTSTRLLLVAGLASFVVAAVAGLLSNGLRYYEEANADDLDAIVEPALWAAPIETGSRVTARTRIAILRAARVENSRKATWIRRGIRFEVLGVALVAAAVATALVHPPATDASPAGRSPTVSTPASSPGK